MKIKKLEVESVILGQNVFQTEKITDGQIFLKDEPSIISKLKPYYIQCIIDASDLNAIHSMEDAGFRFVEFRFKKLLDINSFRSVNELSFFPYYIKLITDEADFKEAQNMVKSSKSDDRFSKDPIIPPGVSRKRLLAYMKKSYENYPNEFIYGLFNKNTKELLAVKSGEMISPKEVFFYHTALKKDLDLEKFSSMINSLLISQFIEKEIQLFYAVTSGLNLMEMDLHISNLKYKINTASVILRKIYRS